jgi:predicted aldo/keto reductase-like oxidoreductase
MSVKKKDMSRREFLSKSIIGTTSASLFGVYGKAFLSSDQKEFSLGAKKVTIYRTLGKTGIRLPIVNMGIMNSFNSELIKSSYDIGVRHFDTAHLYQFGQSEEMLGNAIKELNVRDKVIIGTKVAIPHHRQKMTFDKAKETFISMTEESLERLKTDYVDILYIHDVTNTEELNDPAIKETLLYLKNQKKARFIGFSTHANMTECIHEAARMGFYDVILTAYNYAMSDDTKLIKAIENAASKGIGMIAMKTQCSQYYRENVPKDKQHYYTGKIMHTAVLKWVLRNKNITAAIPGYANFQEMEEDFSVAYDLEYTPEEKRFLEDRDVKLSLGYCRQCQECLSTCPKGVDIPTLMRTHMYAACYANFYQARHTLDSIPRGKNLNMCTKCNICTAVCSNHIDIGKRIDELKTIYV